MTNLLLFWAVCLYIVFLCVIKEPQQEARTLVVKNSTITYPQAFPRAHNLLWVRKALSVFEIKGYSHGIFRFVVCCLCCGIKSIAMCTVDVGRNQSSLDKYIINHITLCYSKQILKKSCQRTEPFSIACVAVFFLLDKDGWERNKQSNIK